jgi:hypothetical protein
VSEGDRHPPSGVLMSNSGSTKLPGPWKHYGGERHKLLPPIQVGDKFHRLTVIEVTKAAESGKGQLTVVCRCECGHIVKTYGQSLRKKFVTACEADMTLERKYKREIEATREVERLTSPHVPEEELPKREPWSYAGDEASLIAAQEQDVDVAK